MRDKESLTEKLSPWWKQSVILVLLVGFTVLVWLSARTYQDAPPIPEKIVSQSGETVFTREDILSGQQVFLKYGLMENGSIWGHGAYLGPDFSAQYLHNLVIGMREALANERYNLDYEKLNAIQRSVISAEIQQILKENRYNTKTKTLIFTKPEIISYQKQIINWTAYFSNPVNSAGLPVMYIKNAEELQQLTAFFSWTAWASIANRPNKSYSYTNNFPYDPDAGNTPSGDTVLWSALSLIALLAGIAFVLFSFGKFDYLGWNGKEEDIHPQMIPGVATESQKAVIKYFVIAALLFFAQVLVGGGTAHYRADPKNFFGIDLSNFFPSNILRTWHLQLSVFWIATAYIAGGLFLAPSLGKEPKGQAKGVNFLFAALIIVFGGSLLGEILGINQFFGEFWFLFGHQGWEYLDLGRVWQILMVIGLILWIFLVLRAVAPARKDPESREISSLFLYSAVAIPLFYLPALFFTSTSHFSVVDVWRFWIIHLWVEGFFELFVTVMVAVIFYKLDIVSSITASRVIYLDAILYLGSGIVGTGHHWYWTGQSNITMALAATFSAMEVVPLTLLTLDAWDFIKLTQSKSRVNGREVMVPRHKWIFYFLIAVGFWNFVGAGIFGFLINLPIISYFEVGTILTPNHGHSAMMGVFGMLAIALIVFSIRQVLQDAEWANLEKYIRISFWGLNIGLMLMVVSNLFPGGVLQFIDVTRNGYWHARGPEFLNQKIMHLIEWGRLPGDAIFIGLGVIPILIAAGLAYRLMKTSASR